MLCDTVEENASLGRAQLYYVSYTDQNGAIAMVTTVCVFHVELVLQH